MEGGDVIVPHTGFPDERPCGIVRAKGRGRIDEGRESKLHVLERMDAKTAARRCDKEAGARIPKRIDIRL
jgi:hypothetical protein